MARKYHSASIDGAPSQPDQQRNTERGAQTRIRILDAAEQIFSQRGFAATRVEDIAGAVGIRKPSVIHHFSGKQELHTEVMNRIYAALLEVTRTELETCSGDQPHIFIIVDTWLDFIAARPPAGRLFLRSAAESSFTTAALSPEAAELLQIWKRAVGELAAHKDFTATEPLELLSLFSGAALMFVSTHSILAASVDRTANERGLLEPYRGMLRKAIAAILMPDPHG